MNAPLTKPLPVEPHTVIRVTWLDHERRPEHVFTLGDDGLWNIAPPEELAKRISSFEILAEPRIRAASEDEYNAAVTAYRAALEATTRHAPGAARAALQDPLTLGMLRDLADEIATAWTRHDADHGYDGVIYRTPQTAIGQTIRDYVDRITSTSAEDPTRP